MEIIRAWLKSCWQKFFILEERDEAKEIVIKAKEEWEYANRFFQEATEPEIIDYAIYQLDAAERKYMYLLEQTRLMERINSGQNKKNEVSC